MSLRGDDRAASVQIGAVILFGFIFISIAIWQSTVVPQENARIEYNHNQRVQDDMQNVRNSILSAADGGTGSSVGVDMAPEYPARTLFVNPGPPTGTVRTVGTGNASLNVTIANATASDPDADDFWDGSPRSYNTGGLVYQPNYNVYTTAPATVYENTVLYNREETGTSVVLAGQNVVDGTTISLVTLNGSLSTTRSSTFTVDPKVLSGSTRTTTVTNTSGNITISFASRLSVAKWNETLSGELLANGGKVVDVRGSSIPGTPFDRITVELAGNTTYTLRMAKVGVGSETTKPEKAYIVAVEGDGASIPEGTSKQLVVEVRDAFNNPKADVEVSANVNTSAESLSGLDAAFNATTNEDGRVTVTLNAGEVDGVQQRFVAVNVSFAVNATDVSGFDGSTAANVTLLVEIRNSDGSGLSGGGGGGGAYTIDWRDPSGKTGVEEPCDADSCIWNLNSDTDTALTLTADTSPTVEDLNTEFAVNNSSVAFISTSEADTGSDGVVNATLKAAGNGTVTVYVITGDSSDKINVTVKNFNPSLIFSGNTSVHNFDGVDSTSSVVSFNVTNQYSNSVTVTDIKINSTSTVADYLAEGTDLVYEMALDNNGNLFIDSGDGYIDTNKVQFGNREALSVTGTIPSGESATIWLGEFYDNPGGGTEVGMSGETVTITIYYEVDGTNYRKTYVITF